MLQAVIMLAAKVAKNIQWLDLRLKFPFHTSLNFVLKELCTYHIDGQEVNWETLFKFSTDQNCIIFH